jgi:hypothetical protein
MLPANLAIQTVYRLRGAPITDDYNNVLVDWSDPGRLKIDGCVFQPMPGEEFNEGRDAITTRWTWFGPPGVDVTPADRLEYKGIAYEVDGSVTRPEGLGLDHTYAVCKRVEG